MPAAPSIGDDERFKALNMKGKDDDAINHQPSESLIRTIAVLFLYSAQLSLFSA